MVLITVALWFDFKLGRVKLCMKEPESNQTLLSYYWVPSAGLNPLEQEVKVWELFCGT